MKSRMYGMWLLVIVCLLLSACGPSEKELQETEVADATRIYATAAAIMTDVADNEPTQTSSVQPTDTPEVTNTLSVTATAGSAETATNTTRPTPCDLIGFISDVTIPDGTEFAPGAAFTKTWQLRNDGTCTWDSTYRLVYSSGDQMGGSDTLEFTSSTIAPGATVDVSVELTAPSEEGDYIGYWMLQNGSGSYFGIDRAGSAFYVQITVAGEAATATVEASPTFTEEVVETDTPEPTATETPETPES